MADPLTMALPDLQLGLGAAQPVARFNLRCREADVAACSDALRLDLPTRPCTSAENAGRSALWLGPDEWLILTSDQDDPTSHLTAAMGDRFFSWVDISARQVGLVLTGPESARRLNAGCPLDLDLKAFPIGMCTRTVFAKAEIVLWRREVNSFHIEVWRSFAPYLKGMFAAAG